MEKREKAPSRKVIAKFTDICGGDKQDIMVEYENYVGRELTEDEMETIAYFANGY